MCELYAVSSQEPVVLNDTLKLFYQHSVRHPHGWGVSPLGIGLGNYLPGSSVLLSDSEFLKRLLEATYFQQGCTGSYPLCNRGSNWL